MIVIRSDEHMSVIRGPADPEGAEVDWEVMERHANDRDVHGRTRRRSSGAPDATEFGLEGGGPV